MLQPKRMGDYLLLRQIGSGGMAEVYLAVKRCAGGLDKVVALKTILRAKADSDTFVQMFHNEARIAGRFDHPNLIHIYDVEEIQGRPVMVMEYVGGPTLSDFVLRVEGQGEQLSQPVILRIIIDAAKGLYHAHHLTNLEGEPLRIVHRDVSPQNILISYNGQVKVFDFGVARQAGSAEDENLAGVLAGKYAYMSPEQCQGGELDERSDIFSLGIVLYELTTRRRLFRRKNQIQVLRAITEEPIPPPTDVVDGYPRQLERIVMSALERDPEDRPADVREFYEALVKFAAISDELISVEALGDYVRGFYGEEIEADRRFIHQCLVEQETASDSRLSGEEPEASAVEDGASAPTRVPADTEPDVPALDHADADLDVLSQLAGETGEAEPPAKADDELDLESLAQPIATIHPALSTELHRARRLNVMLAFALVLAVLGAGATLMLTPAPRPAAEPPQTEAQVGRLTVVSQPPGATITVDGVEYQDSTPTTLEVPLGRELTVRLEAAGFEPATAQVAIPADAPRERLQLALRRPLPGQGGRVRVVTHPPGANLWLNGEARGRASPLLIEQLPLGVPLRLRVEHDGYQPREVQFQLSDTQLRELDVELTEQVELGSLSVFSTPDGAEVTLDGEPAGTTPIEGIPLRSGRDYQLEIARVGYEPFQTTVNVAPNASQEVRQRLARERRHSRTTEPPVGAVRADPVEEEEPPPEEEPYQLLR